MLSSLLNSKIFFNGPSVFIASKNNSFFIGNVFGLVGPTFWTCLLKGFDSITEPVFLEALSEVAYGIELFLTKFVIYSEYAFDNYSLAMNFSAAIIGFVPLSNGNLRIIPSPRSTSKMLSYSPASNSLSPS